MSNEPVAWGVPNTRITERQPFMMLLHSTEGCQYPGMLVPLYTHPVDDTALLRRCLEALEASPDEMVEWRQNHWEYKRDLVITALRERLGEQA